MPQPAMPVEVQTVEETLSLARRLAAHLFPGAVLALSGSLGAGKTHFVRGIAEGMGIPDARVVNSPTFVLIQEYDARLPIYHFDVYRLAHLHDFADLGVHEYFEGDGVCLIEWAEKMTALLPAERLDVRIEITGETSRTITFTPHGERHAALINGLRS